MINALDQMGPFHILLDKMGVDKVGMHPPHAISAYTRSTGIYSSSDRVPLT